MFLRTSTLLGDQLEVEERVSDRLLRDRSIRQGTRLYRTAIHRPLLRGEIHFDGVGRDAGKAVAVFRRLARDGSQLVYRCLEHGRADPELLAHRPHGLRTRRRLVSDVPGA